MDDFFGEDFHQDFLNEEFQKGDDIQNKDQMECEASYDVPNNLEILEQDSPLDDFGDCEIKSKLYVGMHFDSLEGVEAFYREFAKNQGFGIRVRSSKTTSRSDVVTNRIYVCCSEGQRKTKIWDDVESKDDEQKAHRSCSTLRTGCEAMLRVLKIKNSKKWVVKAFNNNHNHAMISPKSVSYLRCHKKMSAAAKSLVEKFSEEGLPTGKVAMMFNVGDQNFTSRDCWNHLRDVRGKNLDAGDASAVLNYCRKQQAENSNFFYAIQCDDVGHMVNFFWVDARSRMAYQYFGDVVTFDTTYKTNKYDMPFAPFTGLNHHCQSILLGCALLQDETEQTFVWLFETWLQAMWGKEPISIITDQDLAIGAAISKVFPRTRHRLCLWHIKKKFPEKLSHIYHKNSAFKRVLKRCIRESPSVEKFEEDWNNLILTYGLEKNEWLQGLYDIRKSWIPVYNRNTFFAGMNTTQRSESINAFFDSFVNSRTTLQDFVTKFAKAVDSRYEKERKEDFDSRHKSPSLRIGSKIEHQAASTYTRTIFGMFQKELVSSNYFTKEKIEKNGTLYKYKVTSSYDQNDAFTVSLSLESKTCECECQLFEFKGIVCRHMLSIFQVKNILEIPSHYILQRWTKEANKGVKNDECRSSTENEHHMSGALRSIHVCHRVSQLSYLAEISEEMYEMIIYDLENTIKKAFVMESQILQGTENNEMNLHQPLAGHSNGLEEAQDCSPNVPLNIKDPHISQTKG